MLLILPDQVAFGAFLQLLTVFQKKRRKTISLKMSRENEQLFKFFPCRFFFSKSDDFYILGSLNFSDQNFRTDIPGFWNVIFDIKSVTMYCF